MKNYKIYTILFILILLTIGYGCIDELIFHEKDYKKRVQWYKEQHRDARLQGWWKCEEEHHKNLNMYLYYDVSSGIAIESGMICYWYTSDDILYDAMPSKGWSNGLCESTSYYRFKENGLLLETSDLPIGECKKDDPNTIWIPWSYVTDPVKLDSLKQYEFSNISSPSK